MARIFRRAIIVGASSGIGEALAHQLVEEGCHVALVARRGDRLQRIADQLNSGGHTRALVYTHDVQDLASVPALFSEITQALGGLDLVIYAAGIMPRLAKDEYPTERDAETISINFTGAVAWLNQAAQRFQTARGGTIVGISSVAGDRGRRGNAVYGATKVALNNYLESLYNNLSRFGVSVVTVKPGPVDTPMTQGLKMPGIASADQVATEILQAAHAGKRMVYAPAKWRWVMTILCAIPAPLFKYLPI
jgi:decaprenylphospho-beta-D-erythro-pentofuranosid-2-ulose 2-reductase